MEASSLSMENRVYLFDNGTMLSEFLNSIQEDWTGERTVEILEVSRPDCGDYEPENEFMGPFFGSRRLRRMFRKYKTDQKKCEHNRHIRDMHNANRRDEDSPFFTAIEEDIPSDEENGTTVFIVIIKSEDESTLSSLDDRVWISGGSVAVRSAAFFYERAKKIVVFSSKPIEFEHLFQCENSTEDSTQYRRERFGE